jgi:predicted RNA-binding Zn-ribbon protein involved in translation (DUF1610 family)
MVVKSNPKYKIPEKRLKDKKTCYVCNRLIHFKKNCVSIPHNGNYIYRHDRCDANSKAWQENKELNKAIPATKIRRQRLLQKQKEISLKEWQAGVQI